MPHQPRPVAKPFEVESHWCYFYNTGAIRIALTQSVNTKNRLERMVKRTRFEDDGAAWFLFQAQLRHRLNRGQAWRMHATYGRDAGREVHPSARVPSVAA